MSDSIGHVAVEVELKTSKKSTKDISQNLELAFVRANRGIIDITRKQQNEKKRQISKEAAQAMKAYQAQLKQRQKYELQFARQTKNKEKAMAMAAERMAIRDKNSLYADQLDHQDKMAKALEKKKSMVQQVASGAFWGTMGANMISGGFKKASSFIGEQVSTLERRELNRHFGDQYGPGAQKQAINAMLKTGVDIDDFARSVKRLDDVVGGRGALSLSQKIADLADPLYDFNQQIGDIENILRGGATDTAGSFAKRYGQGNARMLNATMERQQMLVNAGVYQDLNETSLVQEREARLNSVLGKAQKNYEANQAVVMSRALESSKMLADEDVAHDTINAMIGGAKKAGADLSPEALAGNMAVGKTVNTLSAAAEGDVLKAGTNLLSVIYDNMQQAQAERRAAREERKQQREMDRLSGGYNNDIAR